MKYRIPVLVLGILSFGFGTAMAVAGYHRTIGIGAAGLGILLSLGGALGPPRERERTAPGTRKNAPRMGVRLRRPLIALAILLLVGIITFYGATYLAGSAPGISPSTSSTISQRSSGQTSSTGQSISSTVGQSTESGSATTTTIRTFSLITSTTSVYSGTSLTTSTTSVYSGTSSVSTTQVWSFSLTGSPSVTVANNEAYLNVSYSSSLNNSVRVYEKITVFQGSTGSNVGSPLLTIAPRGGMNLNLDLGTLTAGNYSVVFYAVDFDAGEQLSQSSTIQFSV